jgi:RNA polymerase sigma-70 factor (ECF subfamily)
MTTDPERDDTPLARSCIGQYDAQLHRFLIRRLARPQEADDLAQEVFLRLLRLGKPELVRKPQAYLFTVAANLVREFSLRDQKEYGRVTYDSEVVDQLAEHPSQICPDQLAERLNVERQLERGLTKLPRIQRAILLLIKRDGLSHKEAAEKTGLNVRTVERYLMEAVAKMMTMHWDL